MFDRGGYRYHGRVATTLAGAAPNRDWSFDAGRTVRRTHHPRVNRVAKVVKGGRRFSFTALMVVGGGDGKVRLGYGKGQGSRGLAVQKGIEEARKNMLDVPLAGSTITHPVIGAAGAGRVMLKPAAPGTGVIAGGAARAILEMAGIHDIFFQVARILQRDQRRPCHHRRGWSRSSDLRTWPVSRDEARGRGRPRAALRLPRAPAFGRHHRGAGMAPDSASASTSG